MRRMLFFLVFLTASFLSFSTPAASGYNANLRGKITYLRVYAMGGVLIRLDNQPTSHPTCDASYFTIDSALDPDIRAMLLSRALTAEATEESVNIGYDASGDCALGRIRIHAIGG